MKKQDKDKDQDQDISQVIGGSLNILGMKIDVGKLLSSPEEVKGNLEQLREKLKKAGGKEVMSDEEWKKGGMSIKGSIKTRSLSGENEYHIGTSGLSQEKMGKAKAPEAPEAVEPPVDVFTEENEVVIIAEVPGVELIDLDVKLVDNMFSFTTRPSSRRNYRKKIKLSVAVDADSMKATCGNGILEVHLNKK